MPRSRIRVVKARPDSHDEFFRLCDPVSTEERSEDPDFLLGLRSQQPLQPGDRDPFQE
jgi:hypothetical protein